LPGWRAGRPRPSPRAAGARAERSAGGAEPPAAAVHGLGGGESLLSRCRCGKGRAQSRCRCGGGEHLLSWCRCGRGEPSPGADVAGASPVTVQTWEAYRGLIARERGVLAACRLELLPQLLQLRAHRLLAPGDSRELSLHSPTCTVPLAQSHLHTADAHAAAVLVRWRRPPTWSDDCACFDSSSIACGQGPAAPRP
jgi:hypothetical protein